MFIERKKTMYVCENIAIQVLKINNFEKNIIIIIKGTRC